jgi:acid phosphatase family membrane protein YuiD
MYDATGVRLHAGRQAEVSSLLGGSVIDLLYFSPLLYIYTHSFHMLLSVTLQLLNQIVCELPPEHPLSNVRPLRDSLGHTPLQVWFAFF